MWPRINREAGHEPRAVDLSNPACLAELMPLEPDVDRPLPSSMLHAPEPEPEPQAADQVPDDARTELGALSDDAWRHVMRFATFRKLTLLARMNGRFAEFVRSELGRRGRVVIRSQRRVARTMIRGWRPVNRRFDEQRRTVNERNARLAASYPNPDVNDLLASVNELSQLLFEHPMHTLVQMLLANARAMSDDDSEFPPCWTRPDEERN